MCIDNILVHQKDSVLDTLNGDGDAAHQMEVALRMLEHFRELWIAHNYHYKGREICERIRRDCGEDTRNWKRRNRLQRIAAKAGAMEAEFWAAEVLWKRGGTPAECV